LYPAIATGRLSTYCICCIMAPSTLSVRCTVASIMLTHLTCSFNISFR
jgi:hypothetical protein